MKGARGVSPRLRGPAPDALPRSLADVPAQELWCWDPGRQAIWINFHCTSLPMTGAETQKLGTCSPQNKGSPPRPGPWFSPRFSPPPSSGDLNANKAAAPGAWRSLACGRPLSDQYPGAGRAGGWGYAHPQSSAPSPQPSLSPLFQARDGPRGALPGSAHPTVPPTPALPKAGKPAAPGWGLEACGAGRCAPHPCPPRAAGRERRCFVQNYKSRNDEYTKIRSLIFPLPIF